MTQASNKIVLDMTIKATKKVNKDGSIEFTYNLVTGKKADKFTKRELKHILNRCADLI